MLKFSLLAIMAISLAAAPQEPAAKKSDDPLKGVKCCMMPKKDVKKEQSVAYRDGNAYFCCPKCKGAFEKDTKKFAEKANQQLVQTKQYVQTKCPISGEAVDEAQMVKLGETEVHFCCENCLKKVTSAADDEAKAKLVFSDEAFEKAFVKAEAQSAESGEGKKDKKSEKDSAPTAKKAG